MREAEQAHVLRQLSDLSTTSGHEWGVNLLLDLLGDSYRGTVNRIALEAGIRPTASGTLLQVAANPYVSILGPARGAAARVSVVGVANNFGGALSPLVGGLVLFGGSVALKARLAALPLAERLGPRATIELPTFSSYG